MNQILRSIAKKEFTHIWRDPQTLAIIIAMPIIMLFLYGYAITLEMRNIETAIVDLSKTPESRALTEKIISTDFFIVTDVDVPYDQIETIFYQRKARCVLVIPENFSRELQTGVSTPAQLLIDASDPNAANYINNYVTLIVSKYNFMMNQQMMTAFQVEPRLLYNPDLKSSYFFVPGLIAVIMLLISALLTSITIVREKEVGTMEQILVSPVRPVQIIIGKVIPYVIIGFFDSILVLFFAWLWFDVPVNGSLMLLNIMLILYLLTGLSLGLLISTVTSSQQVAMLVTIVATILPTVMLTGFIFPIKSMPEILQYIAWIIPATHFIEIIRGIMLKGVGIAELTWQTIYLVVMSAGLIILSLRKFSTKLE